MKKIILNINIIDKIKGQTMSGGASYKAPHDILEISLRNGYVEHNISVYNYKFKILTQFFIVIKFLRIIFLYPKQTYLLIQYPCINPQILSIFLPLFRKYHLQTIIHDINSIRVNGELSTMENKALSSFDEIIVHSSNMKEYLKNKLKNYNIEYKILGCFPYIAEPDATDRELSKNICFAGNIDKSLFIKKFIQENKELNIYLYGALKDKSINNENVEYKGVFSPNNVHNLEGSWGLVWDGDSTKTCNGNFGKYLRIIAPHKFSLYILAGLPLIVWKGSAMASLVNEKKIGIVINSLSDIVEIINQVSSEEYKELCKNIKDMQKILINGSNYFDLL